VNCRTKKNAAKKRSGWSYFSTAVAGGQAPAPSTPPSRSLKSRAHAINKPTNLGDSNRVPTASPRPGQKQFAEMRRERRRILAVCWFVLSLLFRGEDRNSGEIMSAGKLADVMSDESAWTNLLQAKCAEDIVWEKWAGRSFGMYPARSRPAKTAGCGGGINARYIEVVGTQL